MVETEQETRDPAEAVRLAVILLALALNAWVMWDYIRERPEILIAKRRVGMWWHKVVVLPEKLKKMERETVFEAIQVVDDARA